MSSLLIVDNGSVYTKNLIKFLETQNTEFSIIKPEQINESILADFNRFILTGRKKNDAKMNAKNSILIKHAISKKKPLLGICYGAEILALTLGGTLRKSKSTRKGEEEISVLQTNPICDEKIIAYESHSYEIAKLGKSLVPIAKSKNCKYEIIQHNNLPLFGTQFHPEMTKDGLDLIHRFLAL